MSRRQASGRNSDLNPLSPQVLTDAQHSFGIPVNRCSCDTPLSEGEDALAQLGIIRRGCAALRGILIPDDIWPGKLTAAVHRFLVHDGVPAASITRQYRRDLREQWMLAGSVRRRHHRARMFSARLAELQFVGVKDNEFAATVCSLAGFPIALMNSPYDAMNYLLLRVYEASTQLARRNRRGVAALVVDEMAWMRLELDLRDGWIDWTNPRFFGPTDGASDRFH